MKPGSKAPPVEKKLYIADDKSCEDSPILLPKYRLLKETLESPIKKFIGDKRWIQHAEPEAKYLLREPTANTVVTASFK